MAKRISLQEENKIIALFDSGMLITEISKLTGRGKNTIRRILKKHQRLRTASEVLKIAWKKNLRRPQPKKYLHLLPIMKELETKGLSHREIARKLGCGRSTVDLYLGKVSLGKKDWNGKVIYSKEDIRRNLKIPQNIQEISPEYAELIGILIGDGCIHRSQKRYMIHVTMSKEEKEWAEGIINLFERLHNITPRLRIMSFKSKKGVTEALRIEIGSRALYDFYTKVIGLPSGKKEKTIYIPTIIMGNKNYYPHLIRGIFDAEGDISIERNDYPRIKISSSSKKLIDQLKEILKELGFNPQIKYDIKKKEKNGKITIRHDIRVNGRKNLWKWLRTIGTRNLKKLKNIIITESSMKDKFKIGDEIIDKITARKGKIIGKLKKDLLIDKRIKNIEKISLMKKLREKGYSYNKIAKELKISLWSVYKWAKDGKDAGTKDFRESKRPSFRKYMHLFPQMKKLREQGLKISEIATHLKISPKIVQRYLSSYVT